ncbi:hypothetical protein MNV49_005132 [Pseudohyphozyma bogoriensis]|nr:hypothetical protein MNV49_005132 [Pseudohyphozyma bogoriensis]
MSSTPSRSPARKSDFVPRLHKLLEDGKGGVAFSWSELNDDFDDAFRITSVDDQARAALAAGGFAFNSFIRQLNYYGFKRLSDRRRSLSRLQPGAHEYEFRHPSGFFAPGNDSYLDEITRKRRDRKKSTPKKDDDGWYEDEDRATLPQAHLRESTQGNSSLSPTLHFPASDTPSYPFHHRQSGLSSTVTVAHAFTRSIQRSTSYSAPALGYPHPQQYDDQEREQDTRSYHPLQLEDLALLRPHSSEPRQPHAQPQPQIYHDQAQQQGPYSKSPSSVYTDGVNGQLPRSHFLHQSQSQFHPSASSSSRASRSEDGLILGTDRHYYTLQDGHSEEDTRSTSTSLQRKVEAQEQTQQPTTGVDRKRKREADDDDDDDDSDSWAFDYPRYSYDASRQVKHGNNRFETSDSESSLTSLSTHASEC